MLDNEDLKWIATSATELNAMLQQISRYSDLARQHKGEYNYIQMLGERVELASKSAQGIFDRVTSKILEGTTGKTDTTPLPPQTFSVFRPPFIPEAISPEIIEALSPAKPVAVTEMPVIRAAQKPVAEKKSEAAKNGVLDLEKLAAGKVIRNPTGRRELILLVDDEEEIADLAAEMLVEEGYKVILAKDGFDALKTYQQIGRGISLVILDFFLPVIDGDAVFDELRAMNPKIDVVLSSGFGEHSKLNQMLAQGLRGFIPKPYTRDKLLTQVRSALDAAR